MLSIHHSNEQLIQRHALRTSGILAKIRTGTFGKQGGFILKQLSCYASDAATKIGFIGAVKILRGLSLAESQEKFWSSVPEEPSYCTLIALIMRLKTLKGYFHKKSNSLLSDSGSIMLCFVVQKNTFTQ